MNELTITLTQEQIQRSLEILGQAPYIQIADVIDTIKTQANEQINHNINKNPFYAEQKEGEGKGI